MTESSTISDCSKSSTDSTASFTARGPSSSSCSIAACVRHRNQLPVKTIPQVTCNLREQRALIEKVCGGGGGDGIREKSNWFPTVSNLKRDVHCSRLMNDNRDIEGNLIAWWCRCIAHTSHVLNPAPLLPLQSLLRPPAATTHFPIKFTIRRRWWQPTQLLLLLFRTTPRSPVQSSNREDMMETTVIEFPNRMAESELIGRRRKMTIRTLLWPRTETTCCCWENRKSTD